MAPHSSFPNNDSAVDFRWSFASTIRDMLPPGSRFRGTAIGVDVVLPDGGAIAIAICSAGYAIAVMVDERPTVYPAATLDQLRDILRTIGSADSLQGSNGR